MKEFKIVKGISIFCRVGKKYSFGVNFRIRNITKAFDDYNFCRKDKIKGEDKTIVIEKMCCCINVSNF